MQSEKRWESTEYECGEVPAVEVWKCLRNAECDSQVEAAMKKLEDERKKQVEEIEKLSAQRKEEALRMEADKVKHKAELEAMDAERKRNEESQKEQQRKFDLELKKLKEEKEKLEVRGGSI